MPRKVSKRVQARLRAPRMRDDRPMSTFSSVRCGSCGQGLPDVEVAGATHPLVVAGRLTVGESVLRRPFGWRWGGGVWHVTARHREQRKRTRRDVSRQPFKPNPYVEEDRARLAQNRFAHRVEVPDSEFWNSPHAIALLLPTCVECPECGDENVIQNGCAQRNRLID